MNNFKIMFEKFIKYLNSCRLRDLTAIRNFKKHFEHNAAIYSKIFFILVILFSVFIVGFCIQYTVQVRNSFGIPYGKTFLNPEHGRYIASFLVNLFIEKIPYITKIHFNDLLIYLNLFVLTPINITILLLVTTSFYFFQNKKQKSFVLFALSYFLLFLLFFNVNIEGYNFWD